MSILPPLPPWNGLHVVVVHLPIGLLAGAPALLALAAVAKKSRVALGAAALVLMALGAGGTILAAMTGEAASDIADGAFGFNKVMHEHEELGELTRNLFIGLTIGYAGLVAVAGIRKEKLGRRWWVIANAAALLTCLGFLIPLANAGHEGGRLVHEFGVRAPLTPMGGADDGTDVESK